MRNSMITLGVLLAIALAGCGSESNGGGGPAGPEGTYVVDRDDLGKKLTKMSGGKMPAEAIEKAKAGALVTAILKADGTFTASGSMDGSPIDVAGTWKLEGDKLTLTGKSRGEEATEKVMVGTYAEGAFEIKPEPSSPFALRLVRK